MKYAEKWYNGYNTKQYYKAGKDCTNFVSQCMVAGGKKKSSSLPKYYSEKHWRPHSATWENATYFRKYWKDRAESNFSVKLDAISIHAPTRGATAKVHKNYPFFTLYFY